MPRKSTRKNTRKSTRKRQSSLPKATSRKGLSCFRKGKKETCYKYGPNVPDVIRVTPETVLQKYKLNIKTRGDSPFVMTRKSNRRKPRTIASVSSYEPKTRIRVSRGKTSRMVRTR